MDYDEDDYDEDGTATPASALASQMGGTHLSAAAQAAQAQATQMSAQMADENEKLKGQVERVTAKGKSALQKLQEKRREAAVALRCLGQCPEFRGQPAWAKLLGGSR